ncbi:MAG TPA: cytochrome c [Pyrinomonadaceae bacterium]|jgi:cytochrome c6|nr:cytochrome c [Pyrinomonadaceae bacterium]
MRRLSKLKIVALAAFIAFAPLALLTARINATSVTISDDMASPRSLYVQNCAKCHGSDGKAQTRLGRKLDADNITGGVSAGKTTRLVTNGKGKMPSFKRRLTAAQIAQIAEYVSGL